MGSQNAQKKRKPAEKASHFGCGYASLNSKYLATQIQENKGIYIYAHATSMGLWKQFHIPRRFVTVGTECWRKRIQMRFPRPQSK